MHWQNNYLSMQKIILPKKKVLQKIVLSLHLIVNNVYFRDSRDPFILPSVLAQTDRDRDKMTD